MFRLRKFEFTFFRLKPSLFLVKWSENNDSSVLHEKKHKEQQQAAFPCESAESLKHSHQPWDAACTLARGRLE